MSTEPVLWVSMLMSVLRSGLLLGLSLGLIQLTEAQMDATLAFAAVLLPFVDYLVAHVLRSRVTPVPPA